MTYEKIFSDIQKNFKKAKVSTFTGEFAFQFNITGEGEGIFYAAYKNGVLAIEPYDYKDNDVVFTADGKTLIAIASGKLEPIDAIKAGNLTVDGNHDLAKQLMHLINNSKAAPKTAAKKATAPKAASKTAAKTTAKAETKPAAKTVAKAEAKPAAKTTAKAEAKPAAKTTAKAEAKPAAKTAAKAEAKPAAKTATKTAATTAEKAADNTAKKTDVKAKTSKK